MRNLQKIDTSFQTSWPFLAGKQEMRVGQNPEHLGNEEEEEDKDLEARWRAALYPWRSFRVILESHGGGFCDGAAGRCSLMNVEAFEERLRSTPSADSEPVMLAWPASKTATTFGTGLECKLFFGATISNCVGVSRGCGGCANTLSLSLSLVPFPFLFCFYVFFFLCY